MDTGARPLIGVLRHHAARFFPVPILSGCCWPSPLSWGHNGDFEFTSGPAQTATCPWWGSRRGRLRGQHEINVLATITITVGL